MGVEQVFCLPHAGGGSHQYLAWSTALAPSFRWVPLEYPGHFTRDDEPHYADFDAAVAGLGEEIERRAEGGSVGLFGHSLGGALAFEVGRLLSARGRLRLHAVVVSGAEAPGALRGTRERYFELDDAEFLRHLESHEGAGAGDPLARQLLVEALPLLRRDYRLHHSYRPAVHASINVPLHVCWGDAEEPPDGAEPMREWRSHAGAAVHFHRFAGGHFYWRPDPSHLTEVLRGVFTAPPSDDTDRTTPWR
ncbi:thioesterase II family protein [Streptomyces tendae]|uniref:thioesterase II family protein n=1 Tax=Streptomyces tendae TaxID=1932 RepID=UPI00371FFBB1